MQQSCLYKKWCRKNLQLKSWYCTMNAAASQLLPSLLISTSSILSPWSHEWWICELRRLLTLNPPLMLTLDNFLVLNKFCQKSKPAVRLPLCTLHSTSVWLCIESITHFGSDNIVDMSIAEHCNLHLRNHISMLASLTWIYTTVKQMAQYISLGT